MEENIDEINSIVYKFLAPILENKAVIGSLIYDSINFGNHYYSNYHGEELLKMLEGNAVYHQEYAFQIASEIASYICKTGNFIRPLNIFEVNKIISEKFHDTNMASTESQLTYVRDNCSGCKFHFRHKEYDDLRNNRIQKPMEDYIDFITNMTYKTKLAKEILKSISQKVLTNKDYLQFREFSDVSITRDLFYFQTKVRAITTINFYLRFDMIPDFP
ncbi:hypothetical protein JW887_03565 [Candidatus Dojkabacteria bacterium]|nr:hypothetical protein [Candidatus Dojkabacteria bacterium]